MCVLNCNPKGVIHLHFLDIIIKLLSNCNQPDAILLCISSSSSSNGDGVGSSIEENCFL